MPKTPPSSTAPEPPSPPKAERAAIDSATLRAWTDSYFCRTRAILQRYGDQRVQYAVFMRRPVRFALSLALEWIERVARDQGQSVSIRPLYEEGAWVGAGEPLCYLEASYAFLCELETLLLQKVGLCCVVAYNAFEICATLPKVAFVAMEARHCAGLEMSEMTAYAAAVGSRAAQQQTQARGFIGGSTDATAAFFHHEKGIGTMPHGLIGYAGSVVRATEMFAETFPEQMPVALIDYFGREIEDALAVCRALPERAERGELAMRLDTHGGRFVQGLDTAKSYSVLERNAPNALRGLRDESALRHLIGTGVSAAAVWYLRETLDNNGFDRVQITASSGFSLEKCQAFALADAPTDSIGTGSFLPEKWSETHATADIVAYEGKERVKVGREFLLPSRRTAAASNAKPKL